MTPLTPDWLDDQYNALIDVDAPRLFGDWAARSAQARASGRGLFDVAYGEAPLQTLDLLCAQGPRLGTLVFLHGGFWRSSDKSLHSFIAPAFTAAGCDVVLPNYGLCPQVSIRSIVAQCGAALAWTRRHVAQTGGDPQRVVLAGHSAGAQIAAMLALDGAPQGPSHRILSISGLHELAPLMEAPFLKGDLGLSLPEALAMSPACQRPAPQVRAYAVAGSLESQEFQRQTRALRAAWGASHVPVCEWVQGRGHFDVLEELADPACRLHLLARELLAFS